MVFDIPASFNPALLGPTILEHLAIKGFCAIDLGLSAGLKSQAVQDAHQILAANRFHPPPQEIVGGLLGFDGSKEIAELELPDVDYSVDEKAIQELDLTMSQYGELLHPLIPQLGFEIADRSPGLLHYAGGSSISETLLTEVDAQKWLTQFWWHRIMVLIFLGPDNGTLELEPFIDETIAHQVSTTAGTMVLLRADSMTHLHITMGKAFTLSCFYTTQPGQPKPPPTPTITMIVLWITERLKERMEKQVWDPTVPREFESMMHHLYHKGPRGEISSVLCRFATAWYPDLLRCALTFGPDLSTEVPYMRWDISRPEFYYPDPQAWTHGSTNIKHGCFMEGAELFSAKTFAISPNEAQGMDPSQRMLLEMSYEGLLNSGMKKKDFMNSAVAVYIGFHSGEWAHGEGTNGGSGSVQCIYSNRINYVLGLKGPSITIDQEGASALTAVHLAKDAIIDKWPDGSSKGGSTCHHGIALGGYMMLSRFHRALQCGMGTASESGRSFTFDASANGFGVGEGHGGCIVKSFSEGSTKSFGMISASGTNHCGMCSSLQAPMGPAQQELFAESLRQAHVAPFDVDAVEIHGEGRIFYDAVDVTMALISFRTGTAEQGLPIGAVKTNCGHSKECTASAAFVKVIMCGQYGCLPANVHARVLNPCIEAQGIEELALINTEVLGFIKRTSFMSVMAHGSGGSNTHALCWNSIDERKVLSRQTPLRRQEFIFWPGGGGDTIDYTTPDAEYYIVGSWSLWADPQPMELESDGIYGFTVTLGENTFEQFQIWLDGDPSRVLHPGWPKASKNTAVCGPCTSMDAAGSRWMIDGRNRDVLEGTALEENDMGTLVLHESGSQFRVHLHVAGKWRMVTWNKLEASPSEASKQLEMIHTFSKYYITGSFNDWTFQEMERDVAMPGQFNIEILLDSYGGEFQIVKDKDWWQVFFPASKGKGREWKGAASEVLGPDDDSDGRCWYLSGRKGDVFRITFVRLREAGAETRIVSWQRLRNRITDSA